MAGILLMFAGAAVDYTRRNAIQTEMIEALDASGLAIAQLDALNGPEIRDLSESERENYLKEYGRRFFNNNFKRSDLVNNLSVDFAITDSKITPSASGQIRAVFLPAGKMVVTGSSAVSSTSMSVDSSTEVTRASVGDTEVALVLDNTGSMAGQKITDLKTAAKEFVDILVREEDTDYYSKVAIAPYNRAVNVNTYAASARGAIQPGKALTGADWRKSAAKSITNAVWRASGAADRDITGITRASPAVITTSVAHSFAVNDTVYVRGVAGSPPPISAGIFTVSAVPSTTTLRLTGVNSNRNYSSSSNDFVTKCQTSSCEVVITSNNHGLSTNDVVYIAGVNGMTELNGNIYTVRRIDANTVALQGVTGALYNNYTNGGSMTPCLTSACEVVVTATSHGFNTNDKIFMSGVLGMTQANNALTSSTATAGAGSSANAFWNVNNISTSTFALAGSFGPGMSNYTSGGAAFCTTQGCEYLHFTNWDGNARVFRISSCVSERTGDQAFTDAAPSTALFGRVYTQSNSNTCPSPKITPLTSDKTALNAAIDSLAAGGSTGGHIGVGWGWYLVSPNFASLFTGTSAPAAYTTDDLIKAVVIMTDGEYNTVYCNGVIAKNSLNPGSGGSSDKINCDGVNGDTYYQAKQICAKMKEAGVKVYTVGFQVPSTATAAQDLLTQCATSSAYAYDAASGAELKDAFAKIAQDIRRLRISR
ncbi:MAG: hypothetical protein K2Q06_12270 [Parvularculaceae bacterium]|nr:hypothetical protein [Parvularculaceae bacterium]